MTDRWFDVYDGLLAALPGVLGVPVNDGMPVGNDYPTAWVTVGYVGDESAGTFAQVPDPSGYGTQETGEIRCHLVSTVGDTDPRIARQQVRALFSTWHDWLDANQTLGGILSAQTVISLSAQVDAMQTPQGSGTGLVVTVAYQTSF